MARRASPSPCFISISPLITIPHRTPLVNIKSPPRILTFAKRTIQSSADEELFIRRHAAATKEPPPVQRVTSPKEDTEEHFDFVKEDDKTSTPITTSEPVEIAKDKVPTDQRKDPEERILVASPPGLRGISLRTSREVNKLFKESQLVGEVRIPTRRETALFAGELTLVIALLVLLRAGVSSTLRWIHNRLNTTRGLKSNIPYEASVFECMQRPLEFLSLFTVGTALADAVSRPLAAIGLLRHIRTLRELGIIISATWFLLRWIERIRSRFVVAKSIDKAQVDATSRIATVITFVASVLISLDTIGINVQTVLAFGGIGGVAIGFAGREIISNFFGGFMIYVTRPFSVGEWIRSIEEEELNGTVEDIGWYLTRVRTWNKRPLYIPNSRFSTLIVENGSRMDNRRIVHTLHLRHEDTPVVPTIVAAMETLLMNHQELDPRQHRLAYIDSFDQYSVKVWLSCYTKSVFMYDFRRVQQDILVQCYEIIRKNGAKLATIHTRDVRQGGDTDRYGPFGKNATFGQTAPAVEPPEQAPVSDAGNSDVPFKVFPQNSGSIPLVRFQTIESGVRVDPSSAPQPIEPNGVPTQSNVTGNLNKDLSSNKRAVNQAKNGNAGKEAGSPRSMSAAAVAAAAAALAAARRNAARIGNNERSTSQARPLEQVDTADGVASNPEPASVPSQPSGEMKITGAKSARHPSPQSTTAAATQVPSGLKANEKGGDENVSSVTSNLGTRETPDGLAGFSDSANAAAQPPVEMKITAAKSARQSSTHSPAAAGPHASMGMKANEKSGGENSSPANASLGQGDVSDGFASNSDKTGASAQPAGEMKIIAVKSARQSSSQSLSSATGGTTLSSGLKPSEKGGGEKGFSMTGPVGITDCLDVVTTTAEASIQGPTEMKITSAKTGRNSSTQTASVPSEVPGTGGLKGSEKIGVENSSLRNGNQLQGGIDDGSGSASKNMTGKQSTSIAVGEMKISKARKPVSVSPVDIDGEKNEELTNGKQAEGELRMSTGEDGGDGSKGSGRVGRHERR